MINYFTKYFIVISLTGTFIFQPGCITTSLHIQKPFNHAKGEKFSYQITPGAGITNKTLERMNEFFQIKLANKLSTHGEAPTSKVEITIIKYYLRKDNIRSSIIGMVVGADEISSNVVVRDALTNTSLSEFRVDTTNPTLRGTSQEIIENHVGKIVSCLKGF
jgi:hypothetical protein